MRKVISFTSAVVMFMCSMIFSFTAYAENYYNSGNINPETSFVYDEAGLFNDYKEDFEELNEMVREKAAELDMNIAVYVAGQKRSDSATEVFADDTYDEIFGEDTDGLLYYLDASGGYGLYDYISTSGKAVLYYQKCISDESIFYALDKYLPSSGEPVYEDQIYSAISAFLEELDKYANTKPSFIDYYYDRSSGKYFYYQNGNLKITKTKPLRLYFYPFAISSVFGFVIAMIVYACIKLSYKFKSKTNPKIYVSQNRTHFINRADLFIRTHTSKTRIDSGGSGSRSGGGGGHSHSGGHGGGGHHR